MKITVQSVGVGESNVKKYGERVNILVNDKVKYIGNCSDLTHNKIIVEDSNGQMLFSGKREKIYNYLFSSNEKNITLEPLKGKRAYRIIDNDQSLEVKSHLVGKYTRYPIYLNGNEIAEGVQKMVSKHFSIDFNLYMLDSFEDHLDTICLFCVYFFFRHLIYDMAPQSASVGWEFQIFKPKYKYDKEWLTTNFDVNLD